MAISILTTGLMFYILSLFINNRELFAAFRMDHISIYASLFFFGFLYAPIEMVLSVFGNMLSRRHEYEADAFAAATYQKPQDMISALKKLSVDSLSNLTPHPLKVFLSYSHPPVLDRIQALRLSWKSDFPEPRQYLP
jgi:STE24 endopeptidase